MTKSRGIGCGKSAGSHRNGVMYKLSPTRQAVKDGLDEELSAQYVM